MASSEDEESTLADVGYDNIGARLKQMVQIRELSVAPDIGMFMRPNGHI